MSEPISLKDIILNLIEKTQQGVIKWEEYKLDSFDFIAKIDDYRFYITWTEKRSFNLKTLFQIKILIKLSSFPATGGEGYNLDSNFYEKEISDDILLVKLYSLVEENVDKNKEEDSDQFWKDMSAKIQSLGNKNVTD